MLCCWILIGGSYYSCYRCLYSCYRCVVIWFVLSNICWLIWFVLLQASIFVLSMCRHMIRAIDALIHVFHKLIRAIVHMIRAIIHMFIRAIDVSTIMSLYFRAIIRAIDVSINLCTNSKYSALSLKSWISALNARESYTNSGPNDEMWVTTFGSTYLLGNPDDPYLKPDDPCQNPALIIWCTNLEIRRWCVILVISGLNARKSYTNQS